MVPHEAQGEKQVDDGEDGVQPEQVVAAGTPPAISGGTPAQAGAQGWAGLPYGPELRDSDFITRGGAASPPLESLFLANEPSWFPTAPQNSSC